MDSPVLSKRVAILIPVHNGLELTRKCLANLNDIIKTTPGDQVDYLPVIVDDGSTDSTAQWVQTHHKDCAVLQGDGNLWWSGAVNMGAKYAIESLHADFILLWNNDIQVPSDYFAVLSGIVLNMDVMSIIGSVVYSDPDYKTIWSAGGIFNPYTGKKYMQTSLPETFQNEQKVLEADWLTGMGTLVPREVIGKIGYWDARRFPQYYGDSDFTYRARINGYKILVDSRLKVGNDLSNSGIKRITRFSEIIPTLTSIKSIHHIGKNFMFYRLYAKSPLAYLKFFKIYIEFFGGFLKRKIMELFHANKLNA